MRIFKPIWWKLLSWSKPNGCNWFACREMCSSKRGELMIRLRELKGEKLIVWCKKTVLQFTSLLFGSGGDGSMVTASVFFWSLSCRESMTSYWASIMHRTVSFSSSKRIIKGILSPEYRLLLLLLLFFFNCLPCHFILCEALQCY